MAFLDCIDRIKRIDHYIRMQATGAPNEFAEKIGISRSMLYNYFNIMKEMGAPIKYNDCTQNFYYEEEGKLNIEFVSELSDCE